MDKQLKNKRKILNVEKDERNKKEKERINFS